MKPDADQHATRDAKVILIIDDEPDIALTYSMLFDHYGYKTLTAANGQEALQLLASCIPDVILSDYMMPLMNGADLCIKLKNDARFNETFFVLTSAAQLTPSKAEVPYDIFLVKPVPFNRLLKEINQYFSDRQ